MFLEGGRLSEGLLSLDVRELRIPGHLGIIGQIYGMNSLVIECVIIITHG